MASAVKPGNSNTLVWQRFQGTTLRVEVLPEGFLYQDRVYRSLSAVARQISGTQWNGFLFFGLPAAEAAE